MATYSNYELTGDILVDRAHWKAAGCPADHPYIVDVDGIYRAPEPGFVEPLAIGLTGEQRAAMDTLGPIIRAQSDAEVAAMMRRGS